MKTTLICVIAVFAMAYMAGRYYSHELVTKTVITRSGPQVWQHLLAFESYPKWNPFVTSIKGAAVLGGQLEVQIHPPGGKAMAFKPTLLVVDKHKQLRWIGELLVPGLFDGEHYFLIRELKDGNVEFVQGEIFSGVLAWILMPFMEKNTRLGFEDMNKALKQLSEAP